MYPIQMATITLLVIFYITFFTKALLMKRRGISANLLGKGDKPQKARNIENYLRVGTLAGAIIQFGSTLFPEVVFSWPIKEPIRIIGLFLIFTGVLFFVAAMMTMRDNWRSGFDRNQKTSLVTGGVYKFSRNPAFVGFDLLYIGCAVVFPNVLNLAAAVLVITLFHFQILGEEGYLAETFGQEYECYKEKVRRYV